MEEGSNSPYKLFSASRAKRPTAYTASIVALLKYLQLNFPGFIIDGDLAFG